MLDGEGKREEIRKQDFPHPIRDVTNGSKGKEQVRKHAHCLKMMTFSHHTLSSKSVLD